MQRRIIVLIIAAILLTGCEEYATYTPSAADLTTIAEQMPEGPTKQAVQGTAVARYLAAQAASGTADAAQAQANAYLAQAQAGRDEFNRQITMLTVEAQSTIDAQIVAARSTSQALDARLTAQAIDALGTTQALDAIATAEARSAAATAESARATDTAESAHNTATAESAHATATTTAAWATQTRQSQSEAITKTVEAAKAVYAGATVTAVHQQTEIDDARQTLTTFGGWVLLAIGYATLGWILYQLMPIVKARLGQIKRDERGDLPGMAAAKGNSLALYDFSLGFSPGTIIDLATKQITQPVVAPNATYQEGTTKRAQFVDFVKGGRPSPIFPFSFHRSPPGPPAPDNGNGQGQWEDVTPQDPTWPASVNLLDAFAARTPSLNSIAVGLHVDQANRQHLITASLYQLMHVLTVGSSGWGKSTWLKSFIWQLARATEPVQVAAIDVFGSEFNVLTGWSKLLYPVARDIKQAKAVLHAISKELERRKKLFADVPLATKLPEYNTITGSNLPPIVLLADEGAALLNREETKDYLRDAVQTARQYGIYCVLASVSANHKTIPTDVRDQFSTRLCFRTSPTSSQVVIDDRCAGSIKAMGRAYAQLVGRELVEIQGFRVENTQVMQALSISETTLEPPPDPEPNTKKQQVIALFDETDETGEPLSDTAIARMVYGYANGRSIDVVKQIRQEQMSRAYQERQRKAQFEPVPA